MNLVDILRKYYVNIRGWRTDRKIFVIESDDWGSIRMPSKEVFDYLNKKGVPVQKSNYMRYDCLESNDDLELLFEILTSVKDANDNPAVVTANALVANPDFDRIKKYNREKYFFEEITATYDRYPNHNRVFSLWKDYGIKQNLLYPQFHGREHFHVKKWMTAINSNIDFENLAFETQTLLGISHTSHAKNHNYEKYMAALSYNSKDEMDEIEHITAEGLTLFKKIFGFESLSFVATAGIRGDHLDKVLYEKGVRYHQGGQQLVPLGAGKVKKVNRYWGDTNSLGQIYWRRNATFEPSRNQDFDWVNSCLKEIEIAFRVGKPAVINTHRVNFSGGIDPSNRDKSLNKLKVLLNAVKKKWPEVEFMNSEQLGQVVEKTLHN